MSNRNRSQVSRGLLLQWVMVNAVGWALGSMVRQFGFGLVNATIGWDLGRVVEGAIIGAAVGVAQTYALPEFSFRSSRWVLSSTVGWAVAWSLGWSLGWSVFGFIGLTRIFAVMGAMAGLVGGTIQWAIIRGHVPRAGWWILISAVGWAVGLSLAAFAGRLGWVLVGGAGGLLTGIPLLFLFRQSTPETRSQA